MKTNSLRILVVCISLLSFLNLSLFAGGSKPVKPKVDAGAQERAAVDSYNEGTELLYKANYIEAEAALKEALKLKKDFPEAHNNLAFALRKQGDKHYKAALQHYNRAIRQNSDLAEARMYRGVLYVAMGETDKAVQDLEWLGSRSPSLASELKWVIENGREKEPPQFFGVTDAIK